MDLARPTPPSTNSSNGVPSPDHTQFRVVRKRNRIPLSCAPCRHRKLKCNRGHPCDNCTKRGDMQSCTYALPSSRKRPNQNAEANGTPDDMQDRIGRLESLVLSLMTTAEGASTASAQQAIGDSRDGRADTSASMDDSMEQDYGETIQEEPHEDSDGINDVSQSIGFMKMDNAGRIHYASDAHWYAILANIAEVKNYYNTHKEDYHAQMKRVEASQDDDAPGAKFLFQAPRLNSRDEVLAMFPSKNEADRLIGRYFTSYDPSIHVIHGPTFQKQYNKHWLKAENTPLAFIAIIYAMMSLALQSYARAGDEPSEYGGRSLKLSVMYRRLTAQTLTLADINQADPQILEALVLHLQAEYGRSRDTEPGISILVTYVVRLAMRMGYHRDGAPYASISPFQAEMRRRVWMMVRQSDLLFSAQIGLPSTSRTASSDTKIPRNLYDDELFEDMPALPPSRPDSETTPMSYMIAKARIAHVFGRIMDRLHDLRTMISYDEVMELDGALRETRANIPPNLRLRPLRESIGETPNVIMQRYGLELFYLKSQCVLHRPFLSRGREGARFQYSRRACVDASMDMLTHQSTLHHESQPGGRLHSVKWYISSLTTHDFLLAAMIVCLELHHMSEAELAGRKGSSAASPTASDLNDERKSEMLQALRHIMTIWETLRDRSLEAWKAATTIRVMLEKLMSRQAPAQAHSSAAIVPNMARESSSGWNSSFPPATTQSQQGAEQAAAMTLGLLSAGGLSPNSQVQLGGNASPPTGESRAYPAPMAGLLGESGPGGMTGLTPGYGGAQGGASTFASNPYTQMYGNGQSVLDMNGLNGPDVDWGAWDTFVQGSTIDPTSFWDNMVPDAPNASVIDPNIEGAGASVGKAQPASGAGAGYLQ